MRPSPTRIVVSPPPSVSGGSTSVPPDGAGTSGTAPTVKVPDEYSAGTSMKNNSASYVPFDDFLTVASPVDGDVSSGSVFHSEPSFLESATITTQASSTSTKSGTLHDQLIVADGTSHSISRS